MSSTISQLTTEIVANYVAGHKVPASELPALIKTVFDTLSTVDAPQVEVEPVVKLTPAQVRKSITPDALISFEDGKSYKTLKRHLTTRGMTIADYKTKWGLPDDYPTTAPNYSAQRSAMAKSLGLGQKAAPRGKGKKK